MHFYGQWGHYKSQRVKEILFVVLIAQINHHGKFTVYRKLTLIVL